MWLFRKLFLKKKKEIKKILNYDYDFTNNFCCKNVRDYAKSFNERIKAIESEGGVSKEYVDNIVSTEESRAKGVENTLNTKIANIKTQLYLHTIRFVRNETSTTTNNYVYYGLIILSTSSDVLDTKSKILSAIGEGQVVSGHISPSSSINEENYTYMRPIILIKDNIAYSSYYSLDNNVLTLHVETTDLSNTSWGYNRISDLVTTL